MNKISFLSMFNEKYYVDMKSVHVNVKTVTYINNAHVDEPYLEA